MGMEYRDREIIERIGEYCSEIAEAHTVFHKSYDIFASNSVYRNAVCLCLL